MLDNITFDTSSFEKELLSLSKKDFKIKHHGKKYKVFSVFAAAKSKKIERLIFTDPLIDSIIVDTGKYKKSIKCLIQYLKGHEFCFEITSTTMETQYKEYFCLLEASIDLEIQEIFDILIGKKVINDISTILIYYAKAFERNLDCTCFNEIFTKYFITKIAEQNQKEYIPIFSKLDDNLLDGIFRDIFLSMPDIVPEDIIQNKMDITKNYNNRLAKYCNPWLFSSIQDLNLNRFRYTFIRKKIIRRYD